MKGDKSMAKDFLGQELKPGDEVLCVQRYGTSVFLSTDVVEKITEKSALLKNSRRRSLERMVKLNREMFLLKAAHRDDTEYEPVGLFSSMEAMEQGKAEYLKRREERGLDTDGYQFTYERYAIDKLL